MNFIEQHSQSKCFIDWRNKKFLFCNKSRFFFNLYTNINYCYSRFFTNGCSHQQYQFELTFATVTYLFVYTRDFIFKFVKGFYLSKRRVKFSPVNSQY